MKKTALCKLTATFLAFLFVFLPTGLIAAAEEPTHQGFEGSAVMLDFLQAFRYNRSLCDCHINS
ncbi:MAG: hypothetical protein ACOYJR_02885 [Acutalibacteraceae bacterium]|jgi:hypothetical protein